ncbi:MAG: pyridoxamine 5'-phosphate oxidase family protein [Desulfobacterota bacterium]|nr:pyridoxamine 5'-phosphate oxidase family protein [Thermodesulfobacteriota bacterium]
MVVYELTDAEWERMLDELFVKLRITRWHPTRQELEAEIIDYLRKNQPCTLATCGSDGRPHVSVVDYVNDGLTIYIFSEGGEKFKNIRHDNRVAVGIGTSARTITSVRGANIAGIAEVFTEDAPEFAYALKLFKPLLDDFERRTGAPVVFPPGMVRVIRITPLKIVYYHYRKGIARACWEAEQA